MRRLALLGGLAAAVGACSIFTDLSGLSETVVVVEAGASASTTDSAVGADAPAPTDAAATDGASSAFCATSTLTHTFCADFDDTDPLKAWSGPSLDATGELTLASGQARSLPRSLFSSLPRRDAGGPKIAAMLNKRFDGAWRRVVVEMDLYVEHVDWRPADINAALVTIEYISSAAKGNAAYLAFGETYTNLNDASANPLPTDQWVHVKIDLDPTGSVTGHAGTNDYAASFASNPSGASPYMLVRLGINGYNVPAPRFAAYYDNVTIDLR